jgi:uncharacterized linocin/CFP29 family protein
MTVFVSHVIAATIAHISYLFNLSYYPLVMIHDTSTSLYYIVLFCIILYPQVKEIVTLAKSGGNYQLACQKHFDVTHPEHSQMDIRGVRQRMCMCMCVCTN